MCSAEGNNDIERAKIAGETARHYGNMRFAMFTVFSAVLGGLLSFAISDSGTRLLSVESQRLGVCTVGIVLSLLFALSEYRVSVLVAMYQDAAYAMKSLRKPPGHEWWKYVVRVTMIAPYFFSLAFWVLLALGVFTIPVVPIK